MPTGIDPAPASRPRENRRHAALQPTSTTLVIGHDGHPASHAALNYAVQLSDRLGAHLHVVHCVTLDDYGTDPDIEDFEEQRDRTLATERQAIAGVLANSKVQWTYHEDRGDPSRRLAQLAAEVDATMIIIGNTQPGLIRHLLHGDHVSKRLLHQQPRPVLVVPT